MSVAVGHSRQRVAHRLDSLEADGPCAVSLANEESPSHTIHRQNKSLGECKLNSAGVGPLFGGP